MDLKEFSNLTMHDANAAKNFMSFLLGYGFQNQVNAEKAIRGVFESFSEEYKQEVKLFSPIILKFFNRFSVCDDNIHMYKKYITDKSAQASIMKANPNYDFGVKTLEYNTPTEFTRAYTAVKSNRNTSATHLDEFLNENKENIEKLIKKSKSKFIDSCNKKGIFKDMLETQYNILKSFCHTYDLDLYSILKSNIADDFHGMYSYFYRDAKNIKKEEVSSILADIIPHKEDFFERDNFLEKKAKKDRNDTSLHEYSWHVSEIFMHLILNNNPESACVLLDQFKPEIMDGLNKLIKSYGYEKKGKHIQPPHFEEVNEEFIDCAFYGMARLGNNHGAYNTFKSFHNSEPIKNATNKFFEYYNIIRYKEQLEADLPVNGVAKKRNKI